MCGDAHRRNSSVQTISSKEIKDLYFKLLCDLMDYVYSIAIHTVKDKTRLELNKETIKLIRY